jgi:hypothetical protein
MPEQAGHDEGARAGDAAAPVQGAQLRRADLPAILGALPKKDRAKIASDYLAGPAKFRRETIRVLLTFVIVLGIVADGGVALYLAQFAKSISWDTVKDWLTLAVAPLAAAAGVAFAFWFPSKAAE